jgi:nucleoside-diphosphate-sugar epimerase
MQQAKIVVAGATGRLGRHVVDVLGAAGHEVVPISRSAGVDVIIGDGLPDALKDADAIIDIVAGSSSEAAADGSLLPGPHAKLAGPTFEEWLTTQPGSGSTGD